jgi:hypothetical protein
MYWWSRWCYFKVVFFLSFLREKKKIIQNIYIFTIKSPKKILKDDDCICRMCEARFRKSLEMSHDTEETSSKRKFRKYDTAIDTSCAFMQGPGGLPSCTRWQFDFGGIFQKRGGAYTNQGPSRDRQYNKWFAKVKLSTGAWRQTTRPLHKL